MPPESSSSVLPSGVINSSESPWPTSIAVTSNTPGCHCGFGGSSTIQSPKPAAPPAPMRAPGSPPRQQQCQRRMADAASNAETASVGVGNAHIRNAPVADDADRARQRSPAHARRTGPARMPASATRYESATASTALGSSNPRNRNDQRIGRQRHGGGAMEIPRHGQRQRQLDHRRNEQQFGRSQRQPRYAASAGSPRACPVILRVVARTSAQLYAKCCRPRSARRNRILGESMFLSAALQGIEACARKWARRCPPPRSRRET